MGTAASTAAAETALDISTLQAAYRHRLFSPRDLVATLLEKAGRFDDRNIWIRLLDATELNSHLDALEGGSPESLPLYGVPFAIKDNIDLAGVPTTAACPEFAHTPTRHAFIVDRLIRAGAIPLGKTNMDQFATGLTGTRSPYGPCRNAFDPNYIAGGSSSGSAVAVALGLASFALGTDTAGSGRVPAMLNNVVGFKPSRGLLSLTGIVPACRSLDCPSLFTHSVADASQVFQSAVAYDAADDYARPEPSATHTLSTDLSAQAPVIGTPAPSQLDFLGNGSSATLYAEAVDTWRRNGARIVDVDFAPFLEAARLLYDGPWLAERYTAVQDIFETRPEILHPVVRRVIGGARDLSAIDTFHGAHRLQALKKAAARHFESIDFLLTPTAATAYRVDEVLADPIALNSYLGYYTNFMNLLDLCGVAVPCGFMDSGIPFGITLVGAAFNDRKLLAYARQSPARSHVPGPTAG